MRVVVGTTRRVGDADLLEHLDRFLPRVAATEPGVRFEHLGDLGTDGHHGVETAHRILEDHRHRGAAESPQLVLGHADQRLPVERDAARG